MSYPPEVERFHAALQKVPGVSDAASGSTTLDDIKPEVMSHPDHAHLPLGALRRTQGGLKGEAFMQFEFSLEPSARGWRALEFLAWWARDLARSGEAIQLRPFALPPMVKDQVQLGKTLGFALDVFFPSAPPMGEALKRIEGLARALEEALRTYGKLLT